MTPPTLDLGPDVEEKLEELSSDDRAYLRERAQTDLYFFSKAILGYDLVSESAHGALCAFMTRCQNNRRMVLMPRGHLKTTICTIADSIRLSIINSSHRILIQNEVFENASDMLRELQQHWIHGTLLRALFPELVPEKFAGPGIDWSRDSCSIVRPRNYKESTYTAAGSGGSPQSKHFNFIKNDDLIGERHKESEVEMTRSIRWSDSQKPLLLSLTDQLDYYGTRKTMSDVYAHVMEREGENLAVFCRLPVEEGFPIFPERFPLDELMKIMTQTPDVWAHDFMNNPIGKGGLDWGRGLLRTYSIHGDRVVFEHNLSGRTSAWSFSELDIVITVDPNSGKKMAPDKAAIVVHGVSPEEQIFILSSWSGRVTPDGLIDQIWTTAEEFRPRVIGFEDAGQQNTLYYFEKRCEAESKYFRLQPLHHNNRQKEVRIRTALDSPLRARRLYILPSQMTLIGQVQLFPQLAAHNWDEIDCLSYGPEIYQAGTSLEALKADEEAEVKVLAFRGITGYGEST